MGSTGVHKNANLVSPKEGLLPHLLQQCSQRLAQDVGRGLHRAGCPPQPLCRLRCGAWLEAVAAEHGESQVACGAKKPACWTHCQFFCRHILILGGVVR